MINAATAAVALALPALLAAVCLGLCLNRRRQPKQTARDAPEDNGQDALRPATTAWLAVLSERERIYRDLHDDIGGKLLTLVHTADGTPQAALAREVLQDLRAVISSAQHADGMLEEVLQGIHEEAETRLDTAGCELCWEQQVEDGALVLAEAKGLHLQRIVREAITNALRHSPGRQLRIRVRQNTHHLLIDVTDDAPQAVTPDRIGQGQGTSSMQQRAQALQGHIQWDAGSSGGTKVLLRLPMQELLEAHPPSGGSQAPARDGY